MIVSKVIEYIKLLTKISPFFKWKVSINLKLTYPRRLITFLDINSTWNIFCKNYKAHRFYTAEIWLNLD